MVTEDEVTDLTRGVYRRQYAGFLRGKRICSVTLEAEAWFWRMHAIADDFGNLSGDTDLIYLDTLGRRKTSNAHVSRLIAELVMSRLLTYYQIGDENFIHIADFELRQPAGKNGKRVRRYPAPTEDLDTAIRSLGESGCIQINPELSSATTNQDHNHNHNHREKPEAVVVPSHFDAFWKAYPGGERKVDRKKCAAHWKANNLDAEVQAIAIGLKAWKQSETWMERSGKFICAPHVWLNGRRWEATIKPAEPMPNESGMIPLTKAEIIARLDISHV